MYTNGKVRPVLSNNAEGLVSCACAEMVDQGMTTMAIVDAINQIYGVEMTPGQVMYRAKILGADRQGFRNGTSDTYKRVRRYLRQVTQKKVEENARRMGWKKYGR